MSLIRLYHRFPALFRYALDWSRGMHMQINLLKSSFHPVGDCYLSNDACLAAPIKKKGSIRTFFRASDSTDICSAKLVENNNRNVDRTLS